MKEITLEELLEAGAHFGHQVTRQNPKAREFVFEARDGIHIIDLSKTKQGLDEAAEFIKKTAENPEASMLIVGTKRQAKGVVAEEIERLKKELPANKVFYIDNKWVGGLFTNFPEIEKNFKKLKDIEERLNNPEETSKYTKKEVEGWKKEKQKLESFYAGVSDMKGLPNVIFVIDSHTENLAVREAIRTGVTTVAIVDTNSDPEVINYPIPANDDASGSIKVILSHIIDAWIEGIKEAGKPKKETKKSSESKVEKVEKKEKTTKEKSKAKAQKSEVKAKSKK